MIHFFSASVLKIQCDPPVEWTLDGEREPETREVQLKKLHSAVRIIIPNRARSETVPVDGEVEVP